MKKILIVFGTRPEVIKMAPIIKAMATSKALKAITCATGQHRQMLDEALQLFEIKPDHDLNLMQPNQDLFDVTINALAKMKTLLNEVKPDLVIVQGDTTTAFASSLAAYYQKIPVAHVEAGLRTWDKYAPFPEEINRQLISPIADLHFAPTSTAVGNLLSENIPIERVYETGNTSIDALLMTLRTTRLKPELLHLTRGRKTVLFTAHRRENFGKPLENIFQAVRDFADLKTDYHILYPVHPNPNVLNLAKERLSNHERISLIAPLGYADLAAVLKHCRFVVTDSGGLQEESPTLGKPVLVLRESTERPEAVTAGAAKLVGHDPHLILEMMLSLASENSLLYAAMNKVTNPFGDGTAAQKILNILELDWAVAGSHSNALTRRRMPLLANEAESLPGHSLNVLPV